MANTQRDNSRGDIAAPLSNSEIADVLTRLAQLLSAQKENPYKVKAYRRAARIIRALSESVSDLVHGGADLTDYSGIGTAISSTVQEIVTTRGLRQLEKLRSQVAPEVAAITEYPSLDPGRVLRIYKKLHIGSIGELKAALESGQIKEKLGMRMEQHVQRALSESQEMILYTADDVAAGVEEFLINKCGVARAQVAGDFRRRTEVVHEISFVIETSDFGSVMERLQHYGGRAELLSSDAANGSLRLGSGIVLRISQAKPNKWGIALMYATGSESHLQRLEPLGLKALAGKRAAFPDEAAVYQALGLCYIEPELREGRGEVELARRAALPVLVSIDDLRGELHAHSVSSDGGNTITEMAAAAQERGYEYIGINDHSQSLKIAGGVPEPDLWKQIRYIDKLNEKGGIRILKSAEVDILADGALDYSNDILRELDYTVCSIHSKFSMGETEQTERIMRAMDNRYFNILGHATGRLLLKRPGYEIDVARVVAHAKSNGCFFEINSSPDRLDLSAENARVAREAGVMIAISTDAHSVYELDYIRLGVDQARRAAFGRAEILNCMGWPELRKRFRR